MRSLAYILLMLGCCLCKAQIPTSRYLRSGDPVSFLDEIDSVLTLYARTSNLSALGSMEYSPDISRHFISLFTADALITADYRPDANGNFAPLALVQDMQAQYPQGLLVRIVRERVVWLSPRLDSALIWVQREIYGNHANGCRFEITSELHMWMVKRTQGLKISKTLQIQHTPQIVGDCEKVDSASEPRKEFKITLTCGFGFDHTNFRPRWGSDQYAGFTLMGDIPEPKITKSLTPEVTAGIGIPLRNNWGIGLMCSLKFVKSILRFSEVEVGNSAIDPYGYPYWRITKVKGLTERINYTTFHIGPNWTYTFPFRSKYCLAVRGSVQYARVSARRISQTGSYSFAGYYKEIPLLLTDTHPHSSSQLQTRDISADNVLREDSKIKLWQSSLCLELSPSVRWQLHRDLSLELGIIYSKLIAGNMHKCQNDTRLPIRTGILHTASPSGLSSISDHLDGRFIGITASMHFHLSIPCKATSKFQEHE